MQDRKLGVPLFWCRAARSARWSVFLSSLLCLVPFAGGQEIYTQQEDVVFAQSHGVAVTMDIFRPTGTGNGRAIIDVASGAWSSDRGKIRDHRLAQIFNVFCARGYTVFAVRPGSVSRFTGLDMADHVEQGIRWVQSRGEEFSVDPSRLGIMGASAGGHLASLVAVRKRVDLAAVGVFFPPTDFLDWGDRGALDPSGEGDVARLVHALGFPRDEQHPAPDEIRQRLIEISPARLVSAGLPPFLLIHGDADEVVPLQQSQRMLAELKRHDVPADLIVKPGGGHPWLTIPVEVKKLADWFDEQLTAEPDE